MMGTCGTGGWGRGGERGTREHSAAGQRRGFGIGSGTDFPQFPDWAGLLLSSPTFLADYRGARWRTGNYSAAWADSVIGSEQIHILADVSGNVKFAFNSVSVRERAAAVCLLGEAPQHIAPESPGECVGPRRISSPAEVQPGRSGNQTPTAWRACILMDGDVGHGDLSHFSSGSSRHIENKDLFRRPTSARHTRAWTRVSIIFGGNLCLMDAESCLMDGSPGRARQ